LVLPESSMTAWMSRKTLLWLFFPGNAASFLAEKSLLQAHLSFAVCQGILCNMSLRHPTLWFFSFPVPGYPPAAEFNFYRMLCGLLLNPGRRSDCDQEHMFSLKTVLKVAVKKFPMAS